MPISDTWTFTDPDTYFAGIRNLQIDGVVTKRGDFRVGSTRIDLHRLWMHRFDAPPPRKGGKRAPSRTRLLAVRNGGSINSKAEEAKAAISEEDYTAGLASMREDTPCLVAQRSRSR